MTIAFLGTSTDDKRFFILCLAKVMSVHKKSIIFTASPYGYEEEPERVYDYCGLEIQRFDTGEDLSDRLLDENCNFVDIEAYSSLKEGFKAVAVCEPSRENLESCVRLAGAFSWVHPTLEISVIYLNLMEYCKVNKKYLDIYWERSVPSFTKLLKTYPIYFEETNRIAMLESQFSDRLVLKALTPSYKAGLLEHCCCQFDIGLKQAKALVKKAERMK